MNKTVSFTRMADGTDEDYALLREFEQQNAAGVADRLLSALEEQRESTEGYQVTRYEHVLQAATRAARAGESEEYVVATLFHDLGDLLAPENHGDLAVAILAPYVSDELTWIVRHHGLFQTYYYAHHLGADRNARDRYLGHPFYASCARFCEEYDQNSFDPAYDTEPISFFEPMVRRVFSPGHLRADHHRSDPAAAGLPPAVELQDVGSVSSAGVQRRCFFFAGIGITAQHWRERADDGDETGVRVEIQRLTQDSGPMEFAAVQLLLHDPVWRADLFSFSAEPPGNFARAHYHPSFDGREPTDRHWDPELTRDPVTWLTGQLAHLDDLLAAAGRPELAGIADCGRVAAAAPAIGAAVREMLTACAAGTRAAVG
jgi:predicted HD phosphohydrolase